eukprot:1166111-Rhodomonas_salina.1
MYHCRDDHLQQGTLLVYYCISAGSSSMHNRAGGCTGCFILAANTASAYADVPFPSLAVLNAAFKQTAEEQYTLTEYF